MGRSPSERNPFKQRLPAATSDSSRVDCKFVFPRSICRMVDQISTERRSALMSRIKGKNTGPEVRTRKVAHSLGLRFRLHCTNLPGVPDLVLPKWKLAIFVHGCFWHQHRNCRRASKPKSHTEYWERKLTRNITRDTQVLLALQTLGWRTLVIWECETNNLLELQKVLARHTFDAANRITANHSSPSGTPSSVFQA